MRRLLLFRHAKAERAEPGQSDLARVLAPNGKRDAALIGAYIARHAFKPDRILVSPSERTRETWDAAAAVLRSAPAATFDQRIYSASPQTLLAVLKDAPDSAQTVLVIGHNPGLHEFAVMLVGTGDLDARERLREKLPTSGLVIVDFAFDNWAKLHARAGRLERFITPKTIARATN